MDRLPLVYIHYINLIYKHLPLPFHLFSLWYPTRVQLSAVAQAIVRDYPFLKDRTVGSGYVSIHIILKQQMWPNACKNCMNAAHFFRFKMI